MNELLKLVEELEKTPDSFLILLKFRKFLSKLPYGEISYDKLMPIIERVNEISPEIGVMMIIYSMEQDEYFRRMES